MKKKIVRYTGLILICAAVFQTALLAYNSTGITEGELGQIIGSLILGAVGLALFRAGRP
ncbi:MAG: hypothetical protein O3C18_09295 [Bacteroidetes bacterium]|nr:hypothetical protein [Bacteroidota bacterium]MDA1243317.1 hypothetical protein [Bacteroidota bacterium]